MVGKANYLNEKKPLKINGLTTVFVHQMDLFSNQLLDFLQKLKEDF